MRWTANALGVPLINGSLFAFDCRVENRYEAGDHNMIVEHVALSDRGRKFACLWRRRLYFARAGAGGDQRSQGSGSSPAASSSATDAVVLVRERDSTGDVSSLPHQEIRARAGNEPFLMRTLRQLGITAEITFLYSIFEASDGSGLQIVYRAQVAAAELRDPAREFLEDDVPWERLALRESAGMLRRYFREGTRPIRHLHRCAGWRCAGCAHRCAARHMGRLRLDL